MDPYYGILYISTRALWMNSRCGLLNHVTAQGHQPFQVLYLVLEVHSTLKVLVRFLLPLEFYIFTLRIIFSSMLVHLISGNFRKNQPYILYHMVMLIVTPCWEFSEPRTLNEPPHGRILDATHLAATPLLESVPWGQIWCWDFWIRSMKLKELLDNLHPKNMVFQKNIASFVGDSKMPNFALKHGCSGKVHPSWFLGKKIFLES